MRDSEFHRAVVEYTHSEEEEREVSRVQDMLDLQDEARSMLERQWEVNDAFVRGFHWREWDARSWSLTPDTQGAKRRIRDARNFLRSHVERGVSLMTGFTPEFKVRPATMDLEDLQAARVGGKVCRGYWDKLDMDSAAQRLSMYLMSRGHAFLKAGWSSTKGESFSGPAIDPETGEPIYNEETGELEVALYYEGDFATRVMGPEHIHVDPYATCDEDVMWMMECSNVPIETIEHEFPERARFVMDAIDYTRRRQSSYSGLEEIKHGFGSLAGQDYEHAGWVTRYELYRRPSVDYPNGLKVVIAGNILLEIGDNPCMDRGFPYIAFRRLLATGSYWGETEVTDMISPIRNYNRIHSKLLEHSFLYGLNMKLDWPASAGDPQTSYMTGIGEILKRTGAQPPQYLQIPGLPPESKEEAEFIKRDLDDISGSFAVEQGKYPGKASGVAIDLLVEQGTKKNTPVIQRLAAGYKQWGKMLLWAMARFATEERTVKVTGRNEQFDIVAFTAADFRGNSDVTIDISSMMPKSRINALAEVERLVAIGLLNLADPAQRAKAYRMIQMEDPAFAHDDQDQQRRVAQMENKLASMGQPIPPHQVEQDLDIHVEEHERMLNSDEFQTWPQEAQMLLRMHVQQTYQLALPVAGVTVSPDQMMLPETAAKETA